jgi:hypothetical protein
MKAIWVLMLLVFASPASMTQGASQAGVRLPDPAVWAAPGRSVVPLTGPWKFHIGDDLQWADPNFDDSQWQLYDLAPDTKNLRPEQAIRLEELPGWQHHGYPGYAGYGWYRIQLNMQPDAAQLALLMPQHIEDAYEVYLNGRLIGKFGKLDGFQLTYDGQPKLFLVPTAVSNIGKPVTLAIRFWSMPWEALPRRQNLYGGLRGVPLIGPSALLEVFEQSVPEPLPKDWDIHDSLFGYLVQPSLYLGIGLFSLFLFLFSSGQREYLWAGVALAGRGLLIAAILMEMAHQISFQLSELTQLVALWASVFPMPLAAMYLLGVPRSRWQRANYLVVALFVTASLNSLGIELGWLPSNATFEAMDAALKWLPRTALCVLLLLIAIDGIRTIGRKAWLLMTPGILFAGHMVFFIFFSYGVTSLGMVDQFLSAGVPVSVLIIFFVRFTQQQRENGRLLEDMRQAQEIQSLLIPRELPNLPGWLIESEYRPARQVGGDFFQVLPAEDGSLLIVVGDVSGKGLKAAMTVSAIVGALRDHKARQPAQVLSHLNRVLSGQIGGFVTCSATLITEDGAMTIANAGHLPPYRNGEELPAPNGLPLGIVAESSYEEKRFELAPGDRLTLFSDGVAEARNTKGELLGFERAAALTGKGAADIADAAQRWGQEDDITVLIVARAPKLEAVPA